VAAAAQLQPAVAAASPAGDSAVERSGPNRFLAVTTHDLRLACDLRRLGPPAHSSPPLFPARFKVDLRLGKSCMHLDYPRTSIQVFLVFLCPLISS
jgi:hypothetical protein